MDHQGTSDKVKDIFYSNSCKQDWLRAINFTSLQKTTIALESYFIKCNVKSMEQIFIADKISFLEFAGFKNTCYIGAAQLLMSFPEFVVLPHDVKLYLYTCFLPNFLTISSIVLSKNIFKKHGRGSKYLLIIGEKTAFNLESHILSNKRLSLDQNGNLTQESDNPVFKYLITNIYKPIYEMDLDLTELAYISLKLLWSTDNEPILSEQLKSMMQKTFTLANSEMHDYYVKVKGISDYQWRLNKMEQLIECAREYDFLKIEALESGLVAF
uniref:NR LBD domain-containing protein n=1 Tax=Rhabditophanes sp. KR3021 TaxID=114890 RepID=A0AC35U288_9BILA